jgi:hypothetical protein
MKNQRRPVMKRYISSFTLIFTAVLVLPIVSAHAATYATKSWVSDYFMLKSSSYTRTQMDSRYVKKANAYTKTQLDSRYVNATSDTMTGNLSVEGDAILGNNVDVDGDIVVHGGAAIGNDLTAQAFAYNASQSRRTFLSATLFRGQGGATCSYSTTRGLYNTDACNEVYTALLLPQGATVLSARLYYYDDDNDHQVTALLYRVSTDDCAEGSCNHDENLVVDLDSPAVHIDQPFGYDEEPCNDTNPEYCVIDNAAYYYELVVNTTQTSTDLAFRGVSIEYSVDSPD